MMRVGATFFGITLALTATVDAGVRQGNKYYPHSPECAANRKGTKCWRKIAGKDICYFWDTGTEPDGPVTWSGICYKQRTVGEGTLAWKKDGEARMATGRFVRGFAEDRWEIRSGGRKIAEGRFYAGRPHRRWYLYNANGVVTEGRYWYGKPRGRWVLRHPTGARIEWKFRNGSREGQPGEIIGIAKTRFPDGTIRGHPGVITNAKGDRIPGRWFGNCFRDSEGTPWASHGERSNSDCNR